MSVSDKNLAPTITGALLRQADNIKNLAEISKNSRTTFTTMLLACIYCYLTIASTSDASLLSNSAASPLPIISTSVPIVWFFYFAPSLLLLVFVYFHLYMRRFWRCVAELPLIHDDGRQLDDYIYPWLISTAILRGEVPQLRSKGRYTVHFESAISIFLAWWFIPLALVFFWARYLPAHDWIGTSIHVTLIALAIAGAVHFSAETRNSLSKLKGRNPVPDSPYTVMLTVLTGLLAAALFFFVSYGSIVGAPKNECARTESDCRFVHTGVRLLEALGYNPFIDIEKNDLSGKPKGWAILASGDGMRDWLDSVTGPKLSEKDLRFANANSAFLAGANFSYAEMQWIKLEDSILAGANLSKANVQHGQLTRAQLQWSDLSGANLESADLSQANLERSVLEDTHFTDVELYGANFQHAIGREANFTDATLISTIFNQSEFPNARFDDAQLQGASMEDGDFEGAKFIDAILTGVNLHGASLISAILVDAELHGSNFRDADLFKADFTRANLTDTKLHKARARQAIFTSATLTRAELNEADLRFANFRGAKMSETDLSSADLSKAIFIDSKLHDVDFNNAQIFEAIFDGADLSNTDISGAIGLKEVQLKNTCGNELTVVPLGFKEVANCEEAIVNVNSSTKP